MKKALLKALAAFVLFMCAETLSQYEKRRMVPTDGSDIAYIHIFIIIYVCDFERFLFNGF